MTYFTKTALAALLIATPLAGAHANPLSQLSPADQAYSDSLATSVDTMSTSSIARPGPAGSTSPADADYAASIAKLQNSVNVTYDQLIDSQIRAAIINLNTTRHNGYADANGVAQIRAQIASIRDDVAQKHRQGALTAASYQTLSAQLRGVNENINALVNG